MIEELRLTRLPDFFDCCIGFWHDEPDGCAKAGADLNPLALELCRKNYLLWHEEDKARRTDVDDGVIASVKRKIDVLNQQRNDLIERLDEQIASWLGSKDIPDQSEDFNSETPGSIVDRISILTLKIYHMHEDTMRTDITQEHRERSRQRLDTLRAQRSDLFFALERLLCDYLAGRKKMKIYRQFKMYNDPTLNPELYGKGTKG
ncbi:MAG: DUF4254 domain-containing protein [Geobacteraceae bacterium]|nr:DUF4254 domain-containing protein [Geobacteraceae bacterium]